MAKLQREYFLQLVNTRTKRPIDDDAGGYQVYDLNSPVRTAITDAAGATITQDITNTTAKAHQSKAMTNGQIHFFTALTVTQVDISVLTEGGRAYFLKAVSPSQHRVDVDPEQMDYTLCVAFNDNASLSTIRPLGFRLKKGMLLKDIYIKVITGFVSSTATSLNNYDFGRSGDTNAFLDLVDVNTTGYKRAFLSASSTGKVKATQIYGAELAEFFTAGTGATNAGWLFRKPHLVLVSDASNNLNYRRRGTLSSTSTWTAATGKGYVYYQYQIFPTDDSAT